MHAFGMLVLLGLGIVAVSGIAARWLTLVREFWAVALVVLGVATAWIADFDLFSAWTLAVRSHALGIVFTGIAVAGAGYFWREVLLFLESLSRKHTDEARTLEKAQNLHRVA
ncbi:hypothetical protein QRX60_29745 [Amycolatopsis mongoliensis]|uniref:Uncharacterized protein n=1 Tax=Amycolatopsis mongoliensis TaxID=715475 RepID=A0A9Y2JGW2_9PSEU|nr:hypothetical protein [Amycolatopsis sp. 4-36]WIX98242.1 hypothetical protein QRX60_29745 [Amycolatopsis sp. 4-36]